ncbi:MAG: hypothetical protein Q4D06_06850, partial [Coriobacteriia bacterium]|nr:hypothetical protein [Coriobacteriia bacterium]
MNHLSNHRARMVSRGLGIVAASVALSALCAGAAFAEPVSTDGYVTCASTKASKTAPDLLGISNVEDNSALTLTWNGARAYFLGTSEYNTNPNPFMVNTLSGEGKGIVVNSRSTVKASGNSAALAKYGVSASDDAVWDMLPDIVTGNVDDSYGAGTQVDYLSEPYAPAVAAAHGLDSYTPHGFFNGLTDYSNFIDNMYRLAKLGNQVVEESGGKKQLRYGDAVNIARDFERAVRGTQGYVLAKLDEENKEKKTFALVSSYDEATDTYQLTSQNEKWGGDSAKTNRLYEAIQNVGKDLALELNTLTVTREQLNTADLVVIRGVDRNTTVGVTEIPAVLATMPADMQAKTYYVDDARPYAGATYTVTANSVDSVNNFGRLIGCLYPEYVDQDDWTCYVYERLYHIRTGKLAEAVDNAMDGVVNWDSTDADRTQWTQADASTYKFEDVQKKLDYGMSYLTYLGESAPTALVPEKDADGKAYVQVAEYKKPAPEAVAQTITTAKSTWSVTYGGASFSLGAKAKTALTYKSSNTKVVTVGSTGRVYIKGAGTATI